MSDWHGGCFACNIMRITHSWIIMLLPWRPTIAPLIRTSLTKSACEQPFDFQSLLWWCCVSLLLEFVCAATLMKNAWRLCVWREFSYLTQQIIMTSISEGLHCRRESFEWSSTRGGAKLWAPTKMPSRVTEKEWDDEWQEGMDYCTVGTTVDVLHSESTGWILLNIRFEIGVGSKNNS